MFDFLHEGYFVLFLIITLGIIIGEVKIKGFSLDLSAVIFVALFMGHLGFTIPVAFQTIGLLFFIFTIGIQAGLFNSKSKLVFRLRSRFFQKCNSKHILIVTLPPMACLLPLILSHAHKNTNFTFPQNSLN